MKQLFTLIAGLLLTVATQAQAADFETATQAVKNMGVGWNLGNTLDANSGSAQGLESETYWGQPVTKPELLKMMKEAGFGAIRIPVTWYNHMDASGNVNAAWMKRVHEIVDYVINQGMYCIVNVHHDTGDGTQWLHASTTTYNSVKTKFENLWRQIANEFKNYDQHLLFEAYNEMLDDKNTWNEPYDKTDGYKAINNFAKSFVNAVRGTGGNNVNRNLVVNTYSASSSPNAMKALELPENKGHIIFQLHSYPNWQNETNAKREIDNLISNIKSNLQNRAPVIIGEYATFTTWPSDIDYYNTNRKVALYAMDYLVKQAKAAGIGTYYWMGLSDGASRSMPAFNQADLAQTLINAYYGTTTGYKFPTEADYQTVYKVSYDSQWGELFLYGDWNSTASLKTSEYSGIRVELDDDYSNKLQVKIYGDKKDASNYKEQYIGLESGTTTSTALFDAAQVGSNVYRITLQTLEATPITAKVINATLLKKDGTETPGKITVGWGCTVTTESTLISGIPAIQNNKPDYNDGAIYNLQGQRISKPTKGIVIQNGKKFVVK